MIADLPALPGCYALVLRLDAETVLAVGKLGSFTFPLGDYVYVGSARGPGGLRARVRRHARADKRYHWHIDYLLAQACLRAYTHRQARLVDVHAVPGDERWECGWAATLLRLPGAAVIAPGFGASDCRCPTHLVHFPAGIGVEQLRQVLVGHPQELLGHLRSALAAGDDDTCENIAQALAAHSEAVSLLLPLLAEDDADARWWAVRALAASGEATAVPLLIPALNDPDEPVRCAAALALGQLLAPGRRQGVGSAVFWSEEAIPALVARLADESGWVRQSAADGLALIGEAAVEALVQALQDGRDGVRVRAAYALNKIRSPQAATPLFQALNDTNYLVRTYAYEALEGMGLLDVILVV